MGKFNSEKQTNKGNCLQFGAINNNENKDFKKYLNLPKYFFFCLESEEEAKQTGKAILLHNFGFPLGMLDDDDYVKMQT